MGTETPPSATPDNQTNQAPVPPISGGTEVAPAAAPQPSSPSAVTSPSTSEPATLEKPSSDPNKSFLSVISFFLSWIVFPVAAVFILHFFVFQIGRASCRER